jgi:hypothetical protein
MAEVGASVASACVVGAESMAYTRTVEWDGSDWWGPRTNESGRANGRSVLTRGAHGIERELGARAKETVGDWSAPTDRWRKGVRAPVRGSGRRHERQARPS